jgi:hypothetical protein
LGFIPGEFILVSRVEKVAQKQKFPKSFFSLSLPVINLLFLSIISELRGAMSLTWQHTATPTGFANES